MITIVNPTSCGVTTIDANQFMTTSPSNYSSTPISSQFYDNDPTTTKKSNVTDELVWNYPNSFLNSIFLLSFFSN